MDLKGYVDKRDLYSGFGDTLARGVEIVTTPFIFGLFGWWIDGRTHTRPLFALLLGILVLLYTFWKMARGYTATMQRETDKVLGSRASTAASPKRKKSSDA